MTYKLKAATYLFLTAVVIFFIHCKESYTPKPIGYPRLTFPEKEYLRSTDSLPYSFDMPIYAKIEDDVGRNAENYWINVQYPALNATLHISYKPVENNLPEYTEDSRKMVYKHSGKADDISLLEWHNTDDKVYGILYEIKGNAASTLQFHLTDSSRHFVRGSFYFNTAPNKDSLAPAQKFIRQDIDRMIESFRWNEDFDN